MLQIPTTLIAEDLMNRLLRVVLGFVAVFCIIGCASGGASTANAASDRIEPPQMVSPGVAPDLKIPPIVSASTVLRVTIEMLIDAAGRPDMETFKATGLGAEQNRDALYAWIQQGIFQPARRGGQPIAAKYVTRLQARVSAR